MPSWLPDAIKLSVRELLVWGVVAALVLLAILWLIGQLASFLTTLGMAAFLSFALEPAVTWLSKRGWKRGLATGLIMLVLFLVGVFLLALIIPAVISGFRQLITAAPSLVDRFAGWLRTVRIDISTQNLINELQSNADKVVAASPNVAKVFLLGAVSTIFGTLFRLGAVLLFTFYFVAEGPKLRRAILSRMRPERQEHVLFVWEQAIEQTGG